MRCALLGAFSFPHFQGSQVYMAAQAHALTREGLDVAVLSYGGEDSPDLECHSIHPRWTPRDTRSGPKWKKLLADVALSRQLVDLHRKNPFDVVLAHNAEAAAVALGVRRKTKLPVIYVVHTLMGRELSCYGPGLFRAPLDRAGTQIDRVLARYSDAVVVLCEDARAQLNRHARGTVALLPPALDLAPAPSEDRCVRACERAGVVPRAFSLYAGNLDPYQDLARLAEAAQLLSNEKHPVLVASHDPRGLPRAFHDALRFVHVSNFAEMRALTYCAGELVLPRQRPGGFPVKLLNYMESGRPLVAHEGVADGLVHAQSAWLLSPRSGAGPLAHALREIRSDPEGATRLGANARAHLEKHHASAPLAHALSLLISNTTRPLRPAGLPAEDG